MKPVALTDVQVAFPADALEYMPSDDFDYGEEKEQQDA